MNRREDGNSLVAGYSQPLIGIPFDENGRSGVRYFADEGEADAARGSLTRSRLRQLVGAWSDMNWDETIDALERIRHESKPTPPVTEL